MLIVVKKTYRGQYGLLVAGQPYTLPDQRIKEIESELAMRNPPEKFDYRVVRDPAAVNRPAKKEQSTPADKELKGPGVKTK